MKKIVSRLKLLGALLAFLLGASALADPADYQGVKAELGIGSKIYAMAVSRDRFVVSMNTIDQQLKFIDTWNWRLLNPVGSDTVSLNGIAASMDINPSGHRLYFSYQNKSVKWMDLASLEALDFNPELNPTDLHLEPGTTVTSGSTVLSRIMAIQDSDSASVDCVFVELKDGTTSSLDWLLVSGNTVEQGHLPEITGQHLQLSKANKRLFASFENALGNSLLYGLRCFSGQSQFGDKIQSNDLNIEDHYIYRGIGSDKSGETLIIGNYDLGQFFPFQITGNVSGPLSALPGTPYGPLSATTVDQIRVNKFSPEPDSFVFFSQAGALKLSSLVGSSQEFQPDTPLLIENFSASPLILAEASGADGYLYVAPQGSDTVSIVTANPIVYNLALGTAGTVLAETFKLKFNTDAAHSFYTIAECDTFTISPGKCGDPLAQGELSGGTAEIKMNSRDLGDGGHILGVFLRDRSNPPFHQGRNALRIKVDLPPPPQQFDLGFGDQRIFIKFTSPDTKDLGKYLIYYGANCSAEFYKPEKIDDPGGKGDPVSPIVISKPEPDHDYERVVDRLVNGKTYCAQIVTVDKAGSKSYSERNSTVPEPTEGPSDVAGEKGGLSCGLRSVSGKPAAGSGSDLILIFLPLAFLMLIKFRLRSKR